MHLKEEHRAGLEPAHNGFAGRRVTVSPPMRVKEFDASVPIGYSKPRDGLNVNSLVWDRKDSNLRRAALQTAALPTELLPHLGQGSTRLPRLGGKSGTTKSIGMRMKVHLIGVTTRFFMMWWLHIRASPRKVLMPYYRLRLIQRVFNFHIIVSL